MGKRSCSLCDRPHYARGWCKLHYRRWSEHGDPQHSRPGTEERFWSKVRKSDGCWLWEGRTLNGYGLFSYGPRRDHRSTGAHRFAYQLLVGPIPDKLVLDHLCRVTACVKPEHLEPVTSGENVLRGEGRSARNRTKTHCVRGHEFSEENTRITVYGSRACRACDREDADARFKRKGAIAVGETARVRLQEIMASHPAATTAQLAAIAGWSSGYTGRVKAAIRVSQ